MCEIGLIKWRYGHCSTELKGRDAKIPYHEVDPLVEPVAAA